MVTHPCSLGYGDIDRRITGFVHAFRGCKFYMFLAASSSNKMRMCSFSIARSRRTSRMMDFAGLLPPCCNRLSTRDFPAFGSRGLSSNTLLHISSLTTSPQR
eukprot:TRINITY_DN5411_c0_g1_i8.p1 TRINITY_DN5411_c0_g1~~TRINITY_DN5411_c0_g1_i8.p1  ORF type:complete len:102 (+),score=7.85 TRINITY_DN5411_c0_g1_i8:98-403(+)